MIENSSEGLQRLIKDTHRKVLLIGLGNEYCSDDGIGLVIARKIRERRISSVVVREESGEGASLMEAWHGYENVILVDAISSGSTPGTVFKINAREETVPAKFFHYSTHAFSVAEAVELARAMKALPPRIVIYGIEGANFSAGISISSIVSESAKNVVDQIVTQISTVVK
jgi:hydrogenase maturation protease